MGVKCELYNKNFQNWKRFLTHRAQIILTDVPYYERELKKLIKRLWI